MHTEWISFDERDFIFKKWENGKYVDEVLGKYSLPIARFDDGEKIELEDILCQYPTDAVSKFLDKLAEVCYERKNLDAPGAMEEKRQYALPILRHLEVTLQHLHALSCGKLSIQHDVDLTRMAKVTSIQNESVNFDISQNAIKARLLIKDTIEGLKEYLTPDMAVKVNKENAPFTLLF